MWTSYMLFVDGVPLKINYDLATLQHIAQGYHLPGTSLTIRAPRNAERQEQFLRFDREADTWLPAS